MKFFTLEFYHIDDEDVGEALRQLEVVRSQYKAKVSALMSQQPSPIWDIADPYLVDDALLSSVMLDRTTRYMKLVLRRGNLQIGYFDLELSYEGVEISDESVVALATVSRATITSKRYWGHDCYAHELDLLDDGRIEHSFLFHPGLIVTIVCRSLTWEQIPTPNRELPELEDRFPGAPPTPPPSEGSSVYAR